MTLQRLKCCHGEEEFCKTHAAVNAITYVNGCAMHAVECSRIMAVLHASSILLVVDLGGMLYKHLIISIVTSRSIALEHTLEQSGQENRPVKSCQLDRFNAHKQSVVSFCRVCRFRGQAWHLQSSSCHAQER
jgi:hypothetical protein